MIINTGGRTDTVNYYSDWLLNRFEEGFVYSRNPLFPNHITKYTLDPSVVDCVVFCSKNYRSIMSKLYRITDRFNVFCHYTITAYGKDVEPNVPDIDQSIGTLVELSAKVGSRRIAWRYDPVLLTEKYTVDYHLKMFDYMASHLAPYVNFCVFSFVEMYKRLEYNMPELIPLTDRDKEKLAEGMGAIARKYGLHDYRQSGKCVRMSVQKYSAQGNPHRMQLYAYTRHRSIQHVPERLQILLCQQETGVGSGELQTPRSGISALNRTRETYRYYQRRKPKELHHLKLCNGKNNCSGKNGRKLSDQI